MLLVGGLLLLLPSAAPAQELDDDDKRFLKEVRPLILPDERAVFEKLEDKADRLVFQGIFWARRDPDLTTPENEFQQQYVKDRKTADRRYDVPGTSGSATDCGRLFILAGKPDRMHRSEPLTSVVVGDIGLQMTHFVGEEATAGAARVSVAVEVDVEDLGFEEQAGKDVAALRFVMVAMNRAGDRHVTYDQKVGVERPPDMRAELARTWLPIVREFELEAGSYRTKIVVEDRATGRQGSVVHDFRVPEIEPFRLRASTPVLSDVRVPKRDGQPGEQLAIITRRDFTPKAALHCRFEVYGAARLESSGMPRVSASYEVRRSDGALYTRGARSLIEPTADGAVSRVIVFPLRAATADDYEIVVRIKDELTGQTLELGEMFSVTAPTATAGAPPAVAADTKTVAGYLDLVERSCVETDAANLALSRWSSQELERVAQELFECDRCRQALKALLPRRLPRAWIWGVTASPHPGPGPRCFIRPGPSPPSRERATGSISGSLRDCWGGPVRTTSGGGGTGRWASAASFETSLEPHAPTSRRDSSSSRTIPPCSWPSGRATKRKRGVCGSCSGTWKPSPSPSC